MPSVISWGELLWDLFPSGPRLGGAAANVAFHLAQTGLRSVLVSRVGDDELGQRAKTLLAAAGVVPDHVQVDAERPTGTVNVSIEDGEPRYRIANEVAWDRIALSDALTPELERAAALCFSPLAQRSSLSFSTLAEAVSRAQPSCLKVCDLNVRPPFVTPELIDAALGLADVVKLNTQEAELLTQTFDASDPVRWLLEKRNVRLVALTRGEHGSLLATKDERVDTPGVPLTAEDGDPVGAGDAFVAILTRELVLGSSLRVVSQRANAYAASVASRQGAMPVVETALLND